MNGEEYLYVKNAQGDITGILDKDGKQVVSYTYDAWGKVESISGSSADTVGKMNPMRYRGYYEDTETGLYYLQSRYYNPEMGRFINSDVVIDTESLIGFNLFSYCENNPVIYSDRMGYGKTYVFYYVNAKSGFTLQAFNSPYYNDRSKNVELIGVTRVQDFIRQWNNMKGDIDYIYLYLHGGTGTLHFYEESLSFSGSKSFSDLESHTVKYRVYLFSCKGGRGEEGNNVAYMFAKLTGTKVIAFTGGVSFSKVFGEYYARTGWPIGTLRTFFYTKRFVFWGSLTAMSISGSW